MLQRFSYAVYHALRSLWRSPAFTLPALLILAIGIGANSLLFSIVNAVLIQPLPYRDPGRLVVIREVIPQVADRYPSLPANAAHFERWKANAEVIDEAAALGPMSFNLTGAGEPIRLDASRVSWNLFSMLGITPQLGRTFLPEEEISGQDRVVVLTDSLWRNRFQADPDMLGTVLVLSGDPYEVVGILPPDIYFPRSAELGDLTDLGSGAELFVPMAFSPAELEPVGDHSFAVIARLKRGVSLEQATAELTALQQGIAAELPVQIDLDVLLIPLQRQLVREVEGPLWILLAAVAAVLLIACVNLANLLLARVTQRRGEVALRMALGARPGWIASQFLTESILLALLGGGLGIGLAYAAGGILLKTVPLELPRLSEAGLDFGVALFAMALSLLTGFLFALLPALRVARVDPQKSLNSVGHRGTESGGALGVRSWLVGTEVALSTVLLVVAGLMATSLVQLSRVNTGFAVENIYTVDLQVSGTHPQARDRIRFYDELSQSVTQVPEVEQAAIINAIPLHGQSTIDVASRPNDPRPVLDRPLANYRWISPELFDVLEIPLEAGRSFRGGDRESQVAVISAGLARELWPDQNPIGRTIWRGEGREDSRYRVVGVAADVRAVSLWEDPTATVYLPYWDQGPTRVALLIKSRVPEPPAQATREAIWSLAPDMPVSSLVPLKSLVAGTIEMQRFQAWLVGSFAFVALLLATFGIYAVISQAVNSRVREIGVRMALGAGRHDIRGLLVRKGMTPSLLGLAAGSVAAYIVSHLIGHLLFGVNAGGVLTFLMVAFVLALVAFLACYIPARRAARLDPVEVLRR